MKYAEVAVNSPGGHLNSFSYTIPPSLGVKHGHAVWVPFGSNISNGIVVDITDVPQVQETREIIGLIRPQPIVRNELIQLAMWIADYYFSPLYDAVSLMLPPGFSRNTKTVIQLTDREVDYPSLGSDLQEILTNIRDKNGEIPLKDLEKKYGKNNLASMLRELSKRRLVKKISILGHERVKPKYIQYLKLNLQPEQVTDILSGSYKKRANKQISIIELLANHAGVAELSYVKAQTGSKSGTIKTLIDAEIIIPLRMEKNRDPLARSEFPLEFPFTFTSAQQSAWDIIETSLAVNGEHSTNEVLLLYGVTGSGKTELYLRALDEIVRRGKKGICLVPEISLTPQMIERFYSRFPGRVAVMHSKLSLGEQYDEWQGIEDGRFDVVIGARSAIFTPQPDLGLIIIDEEHEWSYKQSDRVPRYHTRDIAIKLGQLSGATVILGSATPDVGVFYKCKKGEFKLVELDERITPLGISPLPDVYIVNLREEYKKGNRGLFSSLLKEQIGICLDNNEQALLYINKRGSATLVECSDCGYIPICKRCDVTLTYHSYLNNLVCHHCRKTYSPISICPNCNGKDIKLLGIGTETVERECQKLFPRANILRFDSDIVTKTKQYEAIVKDFHSRRADILIGTQMIAKGLDFPGVTLVGVINADVGLNLPDFRAAERVFQLLCQVSGRAGRGIIPGKSIIQTFNPDHYAIKCAAKHDYKSFFYLENKYRRQFGYPPYNKMVRLVYSHRDLNTSRHVAESMAATFNNIKESKGAVDLKIIGPLPPYYAKLRGRYQMQIILLGQDIHSILKDMYFPKGWILDVDPVGVL